MVSHVASQYFDQEAIVADPWSNDTTLYQPYEVEQILLAENASCLAVKTFLHMCNLPFKIKSCANAEFMSPGGRMTKLPFIHSGAFVIPEVDHIVNFVETKGILLSSFLDEDAKFDLRAYMSLVEHVFTNAEIYANWVDESILHSITEPRNGWAYPWPLNYIQNWKKRRHFLKLLDVYGWRNLDKIEVIEKIRKCCDTLSEKLGEKEYFYGNQPTELDALVFGHLYVVSTTEMGNNYLAKIVMSFDNLTDFCKRIDKKYFQTSNEEYLTPREPLISL